MASSSRPTQAADSPAKMPYPPRRLDAQQRYDEVVRSEENYKRVLEFELQWADSLVRTTESIYPPDGVTAEGARGHRAGMLRAQQNHAESRQERMNKSRGKLELQKRFNEEATLMSWVETESGSNVVHIPEAVAEKIARHNFQTARWDQNLAGAAFYPPESADEAAMANRRLVAIADAREAARVSDRDSIKTRSTAYYRAGPGGDLGTATPHIVSYNPTDPAEARVLSPGEATKIHERQAAVARARQDAISEARGSPRTHPRWAVETSPRETSNTVPSGLQRVASTNPNWATRPNPRQLTYENGEVPSIDPRGATITAQALFSTNPREASSTNVKRAKKGGCFGTCLGEPATKP